MGVVTAAKLDIERVRRYASVGGADKLAATLRQALTELAAARKVVSLARIAVGAVHQSGIRIRFREVLAEYDKATGE